MRPTSLFKSLVYRTCLGFRAHPLSRVWYHGLAPAAYFCRYLTIAAVGRTDAQKKKEVLTMVRDNSAIKRLTREQFADLTLLMQSLVDCTYPGLVAQVAGALRYMAYPMFSKSDNTALLATINSHLDKLQSMTSRDKPLLNLKQWVQCIGSLRNTSSGNDAAVTLLGYAARDMHIWTMTAMRKRNALRPAHIGHIMFGLRYMSSNVAEVRKLLYFLSVVILDCEDAFTAQSLGNMMYGLQSLKNDCAEVNDLLRVFAVKLAACPEVLSPQELGNAMFGLHGIKCNHPSVRQLIKELTAGMRLCPGDLNGQEIGNAIYGLQCMESEEVVVDALLQELATKIQSSGAELSAHEVCMAFYGMKSMTEDSLTVRMLIAALLKRAEGTRYKFNAQNVANSLYGLQRMRAESDEVRLALLFISKHIETCQQPFNSVEVGSALYGLKSMNSETSEVRHVIRSLSAKVKNISGPVTAQTLSNALYGLQKINNTSRDVSPLLFALARVFPHCREPFDARHIGNALYGLQAMTTSGYLKPLSALIDALRAKIIESDAKLEGQELSNALYGFQSLSSTAPAVRRLLAALTEKISPYSLTSSSKIMSVKELSAAIYGLQSCTSDHKEVRRLLSALSRNIKPSVVKFDARGVGNSLYGLQNMNSKSPEIKLLLSQLRHVVVNCEDPLPPQEIGTALYGIRHMSSELVSVADIMKFLLEQLSGTLAADDLFEKYRIDHVEALCRYLHLSSYHSQGWWSSRARVQVDEASRILSKRLGDTRSSAPSSLASDGLTDGEKRLFELLKDHYADNSDVVVTANSFLGEFETDIMIRIGGHESLVRSSSQLVNIEIDGRHHDFPPKILFCKNRDRYLREEHNVRVLRYRVEQLQNISTAQLVGDINDVLVRTS